MVKEFHEKFGHPVDILFSKEEIRLRFGLITEEFYEIEDELEPPLLNNRPESVDKPKLTKELSDLLYVTLGMAVTFGLPIEEVFKRTHESNMSKLGEDGKPIYREDGKVLKGPNYKPPNLEDLF